MLTDWLKRELSASVASRHNLTSAAMAMLCACFFQCLPVWGADKLNPEAAAEYLPRPTQAETKIFVELDRPSALAFDKKPLRTLAASIKEAHGIEVQIDNNALKDSGQSAESVVSGDINGTSLRSALRHLLKPMELTAIVQDEALLITTTDKASNILDTRTYPVADLVQGENYEALIAVISLTVGPRTWSEVGGPATISPLAAAKSLVISQTQDAQDEILRLLRSLRVAIKEQEAKPGDRGK